MDDFKPIVGGVYNIWDEFFDDGGIDINDDVGVTFDGRVDINPIDDGNVDDEVITAVFPIFNDMFRRSVDLYERPVRAYP
jgi:hypothetical protein